MQLKSQGVQPAHGSFSNPVALKKADSLLIMNKVIPKCDLKEAGSWFFGGPLRHHTGTAQHITARLASVPADTGEVAGFLQSMF